MKPVLQVFLNLVLVVSLSVTPLTRPAGLLEFTVTAGELPISGFQKSHARLN